MTNFTNSPLATIRNTNHNKINGNGRPANGRHITKITIHHAAGVINGQNLLNWGHDPRCAASWHYGLGSDGVIGLMTNERDRPWTSSNAANDWQAVTIEVGNSARGPEWPVSDHVFARLIDLCVDICQRNNIPRLVYDGTPNGSLTRHNMFSNTNCPGPFLQGRFPEIVRLVNARLGAPPAPETPPPAAAPEQPATQSAPLFRVQAGAFRDRSNADALRERLQAAGHSGAFLLIEDGMHRVIAGSFRERENADALTHKLHAQGFEAFVAESES